jgi:hypothetical protein
MDFRGYSQTKIERIIFKSFQWAADRPERSTNMATAVLEQYRISDFVGWDADGLLKLDPDFQRGSVWTPAARIFLIDTILRQLPIPKVYLRTEIDLVTKRARRDVVDGQQRLRAILDFSKGRIRLSSRAGDFKNLTYKTMGPELQQQFLGYPIAVDQLVNASDTDVLEIFSRLNSYTVVLNAAERRHAAFHGEFKNTVREYSAKWSILWQDFNVLTTRECVRMQNDSLMAEMFSIVLHGITDFSQKRLTQIYHDNDKVFASNRRACETVDAALTYIVDILSEAIVSEQPLSGSPQFLMLFAAVAHALVGLPDGEVHPMPGRNGALADPEIALVNLSLLNEVLMADARALAERAPEMVDFYEASQATTQRIASRKIRFLTIFEALRPNLE